MKDWITAFTTIQLYEAEMIADILKNNGINSVVLNQKDSSYNSFGEIRIMVHQEDSEKAEEIIKQLNGE